MTYYVKRYRHNNAYYHDKLAQLYINSLNVFCKKKPIITISLMIYLALIYMMINIKNLRLSKIRMLSDEMH